jgi:CHASE2 domain-containing sensor protein
MEIIAIVLTLLAGFGGSFIFGNWINLWEVGSIFAVATMGAFILWAVRHPKNK